MTDRAIRRGWLAALAVLALLAASCRSADSQDGLAGLSSGAETPEEAVTELLDAFETGDFASAASLAMPGHAALASLAEGATFGQVADALRVEDATVAANFWGGFAQGAGSFLIDPISTEVNGTIERDGIVYHVVTVSARSGGDREIMTRDHDGYRVDLFASFAPGLAERMIGPVERLLNAQTEDSRLVLSRLRDVVPSLLVAAERPGQPADVVQSVLRLVELITRVS